MIILGSFLQYVITHPLLNSFSGQAMNEQFDLIVLRDACSKLNAVLTIGIMVLRCNYEIKGTCVVFLNLIDEC